MTDKTEAPTLAQLGAAVRLLAEHNGLPVRTEAGAGPHLDMTDPRAPVLVCDVRILRTLTDLYLVQADHHVGVFRVEAVKDLLENAVTRIESALGPIENDRTPAEQAAWDRGKASAEAMLVRYPDQPIFLEDEGAAIRSDTEAARMETYTAFGWNFVWAAEENTRRRDAAKEKKRSRG